MKKSFRGLGWLVLALVVGCSSGGGNGNGQTAGNTCEYAFDGECDEPDYCAYGTDTYDCGSGVGGSAGSAPTKKKPKGSGGSAGAAPTGNDCEYAYDGECDEPEYCAYGTDSYDCANAGGSGGMAGSSGVAGAERQEISKDIFCVSPFDAASTSIATRSPGKSSIASSICSWFSA